MARERRRANVNTKSPLSSFYTPIRRFLKSIWKRLKPQFPEMLEVAASLGFADPRWTAAAAVALRESNLTL